MRRKISQRRLRQLILEDFECYLRQDIEEEMLARAVAINTKVKMSVGPWIATDANVNHCLGQIDHWLMENQHLPDTFTMAGNG